MGEISQMDKDVKGMKKEHQYFVQLVQTPAWNLPVVCNLVQISWSLKTVQIHLIQPIYHVISR